MVKALQVEVRYYYVTPEGDIKGRRVPVIIHPGTASPSQLAINYAMQVASNVPFGCRDATEGEIKLFYETWICDSADIIRAAE